MQRSGRTPITTLDRDVDDDLRFMRRVLVQADEGLISPLEANSLLFAEITRLLGDGPPP